jgi:long-chain acyl-CoA synthetase
LPVRGFRCLFLNAAFLPAFRYYAAVTVVGEHHLRVLAPPVIFAANHTSHFDIPALMAALPLCWRGRLSPAMTQDFFRAKFDRRRRSRVTRAWNQMQYVVAAGLFAGVPLPQEAGGARAALRFLGELAGRGRCPVIFPEGTRTPDGEIHPFRPGVGMMAVRLGLPVVPVRLRGLFEVFPKDRKWPIPGKVRVVFGRPMRFRKETGYSDAARQVEEAVRGL